MKSGSCRPFAGRRGPRALRRVLPFIRRINQNDVGGAAQALGRVEAGEGRADDDYARHRGIVLAWGWGQPPGAGRVAAAVGPRFDG